MTPHEAAQIVRQTADEMRLKPGEARLAIEIAARAIERGRHLSATEKLANLRDGIMADTGHTEDGRWVADFITQKCGVPTKPEGC